MSKAVVTSGLRSFPTVRTMKNRIWTSRHELLQALRVKCDFSEWAEDLFMADEGFWLPRFSVSREFVAPSIEEIGLVEGVSPIQIDFHGMKAHHLRQVPIQCGLEICLEGMSFLQSGQSLLVDMFPVRSNRHRLGSVIFCPKRAGGYLVDVVSMDEKLPSDRFPNPIRVLFVQRSGGTQ